MEGAAPPEEPGGADGLAASGDPAQLGAVGGGEGAKKACIKPENAGLGDVKQKG